MPIKSLAAFLLILPWSLFSGSSRQVGWLTKQNNSFIIHFTAADINSISEYEAIVSTGITEVQTFFKNTYRSTFDVFIYPDRRSLDSAWKIDWNVPDLKSECWMVASGVAKRIDIISPKTWDQESCEHSYSDTLATQQLITHELVHTYHGQLNESPDFSNTENIDWYVEGVATYASGQLSSERIAQIKKAITENSLPASIDKFWTGNVRYGLSGSLVMYIDKKWGREKLHELLKYNKKNEILQSLNVTEDMLLSEWKKYMQQL